MSQKKCSPIKSKYLLFISGNPTKLGLQKIVQDLMDFSDPSLLLFADEDVISFNFNKASFLSDLSLFRAKGPLLLSFPKRLRPDCFFSVSCADPSGHTRRGADCFHFEYGGRFGCTERNNMSEFGASLRLKYVRWSILQSLFKIRR